MQGPACVPWELVEALAAEAAPTPPPKTPPGASPPGASPSGGYRSRLLVERWLSDKGVAFRRKEQPDGRGRSVWVLAECPFDASHGDPDSCVMQAADGKLSAQCFHDSCKGKGWQHFKAAIGPPEAHHYDPPLKARSGSSRHASGAAGGDPPPSGPEGPDGPDGGEESGLPQIQGDRRQLREVSADALAALLAANEPPTIFQRGGMLSRLRQRGDDAPPTIEPLSDAALRGVRGRRADWWRVRETRKGPVLEPGPPPMDAVRDLSSLPDWEGVPVLDAVIESPAYGCHGGLVLAPGFHAEARLWLHPGSLVVPAVPDAPSPGEVAIAVRLLRDELMGDFPFADNASVAHALAALLLPFVRGLVDGPTPLHLFDAPTEGTGKTLLASAVGLVATGRDPEAVAEASCDEEWRKRITAVLSEGPAIVLLDNLSRPLDSGALAAALTCRLWKDRLLGFSRTVSLPVRCVWMATGNNARLSRELQRRTVWIRLDAGVQEPWQRKGFRHPSLQGWVRKERGRLVHAALVLCQAWRAAGSPPGAQSLGGYEAWSAVLGGILDVAGVPGFLGNAQAFRAGRSPEAEEWGPFARAWMEEFGERLVGASDLHGLAVRQKLLDSVLGDGGDRSQRVRLGLALSQAAGRVFSDARVERGEDDHKGRQRYRLLRQAAPPGTATGAGTAEWTA